MKKFKRRINIETASSFKLEYYEGGHMNKDNRSGILSGWSADYLNNDME